PPPPASWPGPGGVIAGPDGGGAGGGGSGRGRGRTGDAGWDRTGDAGWDRTSRGGASSPGGRAGDTGGTGGSSAGAGRLDSPSDHGRGGSIRGVSAGRAPKAPGIMGTSGRVGPAPRRGPRGRGTSRLPAAGCAACGSPATFL